MKDRKAISRLAGVASAALVLALTLDAGTLEASIFRDVLAKVGIGKPTQQAAPPGSVHQLPWKGFTCCNLHYDKDWISDSNYSELPMIPAGTPIEVTGYGRNRAFVKVDGREMKLGHDYGRDQESLEAWVAKIVVDESPRGRIDSYPTAVREAIYQGKVSLGMTREQAIASVGYPITSENGTIDSSSWRVWRSRHDEYQLNFRPDGRLGSVTGDSDVTREMLYSGGK